MPLDTITSTPYHHIQRAARDYTLHPYRLSDSAFGTLHLCQRKFQLDRLLENVDREAQIGRGFLSPEAIRGQAYGAGVQAYMLTGDMDAALFEAWQNYWPMEENPPKTFEGRVLNNLVQSKEAMDQLRRQYQVAVFDGQPALELSFRLNLDADWYYVGYIDVVLQDKQTGEYGVLEVKSTYSTLQDLRPMYQYSGQALGYSIVLDQIAGSNQTTFSTPYFVCREHTKDFVPDIYIFPFARTLLDRFKWFLTLGMDLQTLNRMKELNHFPQRHEGCISYGRVCPHFGLCGLTASDRPRAIPVDRNVYQFEYDLSTVIEDHVKRIGAGQ